MTRRIVASDRYGAPADVPRVYLASRFSRRSEMRSHAAELEALGIATVDIAWLREDHDWDGEALAQARSLALDDMRDIGRSDLLIAFTERPGGCRRGGRHVELGIALGLGMRVMVVGPLENVFAALPQVQRFEHWRNCLGWLVRSSGDYWWDRARLPAGAGSAR